MSAASKHEPKFPWDIEVPETPFWSDLDHNLAVSFLSCFPNKDEVSRMSLDDLHLSPDQKIQHLSTIIDDTLAAKTAAVAVNEIDPKTFKASQIAFATHTGDYTKAETLLADQDDHGYGLAFLRLKMGRYAEAEAAAREALPWIRGMLETPDSPQTLGILRGVMVPSLWKQGREEESKEYIRESLEVIDRMAKGKFAKYEEEERKELVRVVVEIQKKE